MNHRLLVLTTLVLAVAVAAPALAEESTVDRTQENPTGVVVGEGTRAADETSQSSIVRAFHERWEEASTLEESGWSQEYVKPPERSSPEDYFRLVHRKDDNPFRAPRATPIPAESAPHAVTTMRDSGKYVGREDARLISPTLDLRYVRGFSGSFSEPYRNEDAAAVLSDLRSAYNENQPSGYLFSAGYHELLFNPPSGWFPLPCPQGAPQDPCSVPAGGYDQANSDAEGGEAYDAYQQPTPESCNEVEVFFFFVGQCVPEQTVPVPGTRQFGLYADEKGQIHAPNPVDQREGMSYINLTFWHKWELDQDDAVYLEVRERREDGSWSDWRVLEPAEGWNQPSADPSTRHHQETSGERTMAYNGWYDNHRAFVGTSNGLVASTFNLNRFAGTEIQLAWRSSSVSRPNNLGWFIDDVVLWTNTYQRDVGVRQIEQPRSGDRVAPSEPYHPSATIRNYGHLPVEDIRVTFRVTPSDDTDQNLWSDTQFLDRLGPQEEVELSSLEAFDPEADLPGDPTGSYRLVANVTPYAAPEDASKENLTHRPETAPNDDNDQSVVPFQVQPKPRAEVAIDVPQESVQTDVGTAKTFTVRMENTGNVPLSGPVEVTATRLNRTTLEPAGDARVIDRVQIRPGEFPFGQKLTALGSEDNTWTRSFKWDEGLDTPGIYRLRATLEAGHGTFEGTTPVYIRATPAPYYEEAADDLLDVPFSDRSVYSAGMRVEAWNASIRVSGTDGALVSTDPVLPSPVSPTHVWYGRGDDGGIGTQRQAQRAEEVSGTEQDVSDSAGIAEPDSQEQTRDPNYVDHYWLTREVNLTTYDDPGTRLVLTFWHTAEFNWSGGTVSGQRGRVEILPQDNAYLTDPTEGVAGTGPQPPEAETGVGAVDDRTPATDDNVTLVSGDALYAQALDSWETPVPWTQERVDLTPWKGEAVTLRFHLETAASRRSVNGSDGGTLPPWIVDNVQLSAKADGEARTVFRTDVEGDDWKRWSTADGVRVEDPRSPVAVAQSPGDKVVGSSLEGRGWQRYAYGDTTLPSGWHVTERSRPEAGTRVQSPMFRWGDPTTIEDELPANVNLSILRTPEISLQNARDPVLTFRQNYTFPNPPGLTSPDNDQRNLYPHSQSAHIGDGHVLAGGSVWIVGENDEGEVVKRDLLVPTGESETNYDAIIANWYTGTPSCAPDQQRGTSPATTGALDPTEVQEPGGNELHCETPLRDYPYQNLSKRVSSGPPAKIRKVGGNVFANRSGVAPDALGSSRWERAAFDLSPYAEPGNASLDYHIEFHAINQRTDKPEALGWLVDDIQITERTFANDVAVDEVVRPGGDQAVGPGLQVPVALRLQNEGLYDQVGVQATYRVLDQSGEVVFGPVTGHTSSGKVIPGARSTESPDKNETLVFDTPWETPKKEGTYVIEGEVHLEDSIGGHAFPDANPSNDILRQQVEVTSRRSVGILPAEEHPDEDVVDPFVGTNGTFRTLKVFVENRGTLPEVFTGDDAGEFAVNLTIRNAAGDVVKQTESPIRRLAPGEVRKVTFRSAWRPENTGVYDIRFRLDHPNETASRSARDDARSLTYTVFDRILPRQGEDLGSMFRPEGAGWSFQDGSWTFGRGEEYRNGADDALVLEKPLALKDLRRGVIRLNHSYGFEAGYDGGRLEVKPVDGDTWYPVPPEPLETGYPVNMSSGSPFVDEPGGVAGALSGNSGGGDVPTTQETAFNLAGVDPLVRKATIFRDDFTNASVGDTARESSIRHGNWSTSYLSRVLPHSGDKMFRSNDTIVIGGCWRFFYENSGGSDESKCQVNDYYDSRKYLNVTFDEDHPPEKQPLNRRLAREDVESLRVTFWDYRSIGLTRGGEGTDLSTANEVSVRLTCVGEACPKGASRILNPVRSDSYDNNYRGWTKNVYEIPSTALEPFTGPGKALRLSFVHHVLNGNYHESRGTGLHATDAGSLHAGWFVDDVAIEIAETDGDVETYWTDDIESRNRTFEHNVQSKRRGGDVGRKEILNVGPWSGDSYTMGNPELSVSACNGAGCRMPRLLWDPVSAWGGEAICSRPGTPEEILCSSLPEDARENASKRHGLWRHVEPPKCGAASAPSALTFHGELGRAAETRSLNVTDGGSITFQLTMGEGSRPRCETADDGEIVRLQYSLDGGATWKTVRNFSASDFRGFSKTSVSIPDEAATGSTAFRWIQPSFSEPNGDNWAVDNVDIAGVLTDDFDDGLLNRSRWNVTGGAVQGEFPCGPLVDEELELAQDLRKDKHYPKEYRAEDTHFRACGPTRKHRDRAGGARLVTTVNLRPAVGDVTLNFSHEFRFQHKQDPLRGRSGGRLEVSVDGGDTWIPLQPVSNDTRPMIGQNETQRTAQQAAHTTIGGIEGDPEGDSIYGIGGQAWTGVSGDAVATDGAEPETATYDLSRFAGRKVKVAWHAYFGTHNYTRTTAVDPIKGAYEYWAVRNVSIDAEVLDAERLDLRLRAATDGSKADRGWTVNDLRMAGTNTGVNVAGKILGIPDEGPVKADSEKTFSVALLNKGERKARVDVDVSVLDGSGSEVFEASEDQIPLRSEARVTLDEVGGEELQFDMKASTSYTLRTWVNVTDEDLLRREAVRADNHHSIDVEDVRKRGSSTLEVKRFRATPNNVPSSTDGSVRVEAVILNDGFGSPTVDEENLAIAFNSTTERGDQWTLVGKEPIDESPSNPTFRRSFQTKTYTWILPADDLRANLTEGIYDIELQMKSKTGASDDAPEGEPEPLYFGGDFFAQWAYTEDVGKDDLDKIGNCQYTNQDAQPEGQSPAPTSPTWETSEAANQSRPYSFKWLAQGYSSQPYRGSVACRVPNLPGLGETLRQNLQVHFWTRYRLDDEDVSLDILTGTSDECDQGGVHGLPRFSAKDGVPVTPSFTEKEFAHRTAPFAYRGHKSGCFAFEVREHSGQNEPAPSAGQAYVDDITVSPFHVDLSPERTVARISDNTVKRFPFNVTNEGAFNDTYRFALVDGTGQPAAGPRSWDFHVETPDGDRVRNVSVAAGETRSLLLVVDIPVQGVSTSGTAKAVLSAISQADGVVRDTTGFTFRFDYPPRPNLDIIGTSINNRDRPAGSPRSVTVTVANVGIEPAEEVPVAIVDRMPPRFGVAPNQLTTVDGKPLPNVTLEPGQTTTLIAGWTPRQAGPHNLSVQIDPDNTVAESDEEDNTRVLQIPIESAKFPDLAVDLEVSDSEPEAGSAIHVNATVTNEGKAVAQGVRVTYRVGVSDLLSGEAPHILDEVIQPGETVRLEAKWPASFPGDYKAFLKAIPLSRPLEPEHLQEDNLAVSDVKVRSPGLQVTGPEGVVNASQGQEVQAPITIENRGETNETVDVTAQAQGDLRARIVRGGVSVTQVDVARGTFENLTLQVRAPSQAVADTYTATVTVVSTNTGQTERVHVPVRIAPERGLDLKATAVDVEPGGGTLPLTVTNTGNVPTTVNVSARRIPDGWSVDAQATLEPFSSTEVEAALQVPTNASAGVRDLVVTATSRATRAQAPVRVDVGTRGVLDVTLEPGDVALRPGRTVTFNATLDSVGNVPAFPDLEVDAPGTWTVDLPRPRARIPEGESLSFQVSARIPQGAERGDHALVLVAQGEEETFTGNASVRVGLPDAAVTNVEQNPRVNIEAGQNVTFAATVRNTGGLDLAEAGLGVYVDDALTDFASLTDVGAGGKTEVTLDWTAEAGEHVILLVADPGERVTEDDEGNNARLLVVQVGGGAQVFGDVQRAVPVSAGLGLAALLAAALGRRWAV